MTVRRSASPSGADAEEGVVNSVLRAIRVIVHSVCTQVVTLSSFTT